MWNLEYDTNQRISETITDSDIENRLAVAKEWQQVVERREGKGVWEQQRQTVIHKMDKHQYPTGQHRELYTMSVTNHSGKEYEKESMYLSLSTYRCITEYFAVQKKLTQHCKSTVLQ